MKLSLPPSRTIFRRLRTRSSQGFSLVEVVLAMGVLSFAMVGFAGIVPVALGTLRQTMDLNIESQIFQSLTSETQALNYSQVSSTSTYGKSFPRTYDDQGQLLTASSSSAFVAAYKVELALKPCQVPGAGADSPNAQALNITCTNLHKKGSAVTYSIWVVDNGR